MGIGPTLHAAVCIYIQFIQLIYNKALKNNRPSNCLVNGQTSKTDKQTFYDMETEVDNNNPQQKRGLDVNRYATKKTIAQGMLDVALLTANASQLKYVLQLGEERHEFYHLMLALIILSIVLQAIVALISFSLNFLRDCRLEQETYKTSALVINYFSLGLVFLTSTLNILIAGLDPRTQI